MNRKHRSHSPGDSLWSRHTWFFSGLFTVLFLENSPQRFESLDVSLQSHSAAMFGSQLVLEPSKQEWGRP